MNPTSNTDTILLGARTEKGLREENQDALTNFESPFGFVYLVADGMGGMQGGATASKMTVDCYRKYLTSLTPELSNAEALQRATAATNAEIRAKSQSGGPSVAGMGSTVVMAVFANTETGLRGTIAHVGDSRAYLLRRGQMSRLTKDHSAVQRLIDSNQITEAEARSHPDSSVITRALGPHEEVAIEVSESQFEAGDIVLLCSDGLCGYVEDGAIAAELARPREPVQTAEALIALALSSGSSDNITVQVMKVAPPVRASRGTAFAPTMRPAPSSAPRFDVTERGKSSRWLPWLSHGAALVAGVALGLILSFPLRPYLPGATPTNQKTDTHIVGTNPCPNGQVAMTPPSVGCRLAVGSSTTGAGDAQAAAQRAALKEAAAKRAEAERVAAQKQAAKEAADRQASGSGADKHDNNSSTPQPQQPKLDDDDYARF